MDSKMIEKEFDRWWNTFKSQATRQYPVKAAREAWAACATLMANRVKELEIAYQKTGSSNLDLSESLMFADEAIDLYKKDVSDLQAVVSSQATSLRELESKVKELEAEYKKEYDLQEKTYNRLMDALNKISELQAESVKWTHTAQYRLSQHLQSKLDEAVSVIKIIKENVIHYVVTEEEQHLAYNIEKFLESIDKSYLQEKGGGGSNKSGSQYKTKEEAEQFLSSLDKPIKEDR